MICFPYDDEFVIPIFVSILKVIQKHEQIGMKLICQKVRTKYT